MSNTTALYAISAALHKAEEFAKTNDWVGINDSQKQFLKKFFPSNSESAHFTPEELESIASLEADEINAFLKQKGFDIKLDPIPEGGFGSAAVMCVAVKWENPGTKTVFYIEKKKFDAARFKDVSTYNVDGWNSTVVKLNCD